MERTKLNGQLDELEVTERALTIRWKRGRSRKAETPQVAKSHKAAITKAKADNATSEGTSLGVQH